MNTTNVPSNQLPGNPMMWILIGSEIAVFGAGLLAFAGARIAEPEIFAQSQATLDRLAGTINTAILLTSGMFAALAVNVRMDGRRGRARAYLLCAGLLGAAFFAVKVWEYSVKFEAGIGLETNNFFTLYYLLTGFHALHVLFGLIVLALVAKWDSVENLETGTAFWHMVDMIWVLIFPVIYLAR